MARSLWKGPFIGVKLTKVSKNNNLDFNTKTKSTEKRNLDLITYSRSAVILKEWIGLNIGVHNGKKFMPVFIISPMVGHKLGEFSRTRIKPMHPKKNERQNTVKKTGSSSKS